MLRALSTISRVVTKVEELCLAWGVLAIAALTIANVVGRTFGASLAFAEELASFLMILVTFLGIGYAAGKARHIRMTALYDQLGARARRGLMLLISSTTAALLLALAWLSVDYTFGTMRELGSVSPVLGVPLWAVYLVVPVGFVLGAIQYLLTFAKNLAERDADVVWLSFEHRDGYEEEPPVGV